MEFNCLFDKEIHVGISDVTQESYFLFFKQIFFKIETKEMAWNSMRTFEDFNLLRKALELTFPFIVIPRVDYAALKNMGYFWGSN